MEDGHIQGAIHIPLTRPEPNERAPDGKTIVTVCASGHRSAVAARTLQRAGYTVENLKGGTHAWARAGLALGKRAGARD